MFITVQSEWASPQENPQAQSWTEPLCEAGRIEPLNQMARKSRGPTAKVEGGRKPQGDLDSSVSAALGRSGDRKVTSLELPGSEGGVKSR